MIKRILIVDDAPVTLTMAKQQAEKEGYVVYVAGNGKEGLKIVRSKKIDLVITDVVMPVMDGVDFFNALKSDPSTMHIPVIVITDSMVIQESFRALGVNDFLAKPFDGSVLIERIQRIKKLELGPHRHGKVVIIGAGTNDGVLEMRRLLEKNGCSVVLSSNGVDSIAKVLRVVPHIVLIDVMLTDVSAKEVIKALRSFIKLQDMKILVYTFLSPEKMFNVEAVEQLKDSKNACMDAGGTDYIGRFSALTFIDSMHKYWIHE
ncbi:MAG: hypothetical protein A2Y03_03985 [Omnitrophica WOR_2 bacterium GWF2_38_59]|nr:MAG: hypothetical protein A2Y06_02340 [Omnitrophica WOR_2 bacterium GWA2_37_7]OGX22329.1 MAG: hypothetical protein A2Y03_03985 [Omnitrophica WOR_2 bacterium GWF2_38_59]OGX50264.1 MAG: hypothetical protein A2243_07140 [Omnitrophica WOR_2 bacterium RIFOXYA2_FULL_38_17]OGX50892.1 MAG: hypothetical protein A2267_00965 [Omnitrophica WOR_2 bacterium RIFOXYA12_FULL_38_10]OGX56727.1 MAG: hypothetical protein A2306_02195 [Omnitrophica WOR_2 bacterium RIFOXYB2_FULL_38_16]OGX57253.1 MAG: hypothetical 